MVKPQFKASNLPWHLILVFFLLAIGIATLGYLYYKNQKEDIKKAKADELFAIADLKVNQIVNWRKERLGDATVISESPLITSGVQQYLENPKDSKLRENILTWMASLQKNHDYERVILFDTKGVIKLSVPEKNRMVYSRIRQSTTEAIHTKRIIFTDFHRSEPAGSIYLGILVPLLVPKGQDILPAGVLLLEINPSRFLYPFIQSWPTPSRTSETLLIRREGNDVVYLNELRHRRNTALNLRFPLSKPQLPAAMVVQRKEGVVEGLDYRGVPVVAAMRSVPESPWFLVAKADKEEIYKPIHERALIIAILSGLFIGFAGITLGLIWRHQRSRVYRKLYEGDLERERVTQRLDFLMKHANDIIVLMDDKRRIVDVNDRAVESYGYTRDELLQLREEDLRPPEFRPLFDAQIEQVNEHNGFLYETVHQKKDGTTFPVEVSSRPILVSEKKFYQSIIRDITQRIRSEEALKESEKRYRQVVENAAEIIYSLDTKGNFTYSNAAGLKTSGFSLEELQQFNYQDLIVPEHRERLAGIYTNQFREKQATTYVEFPFLNKFGKVVWWGQNASLVTEDGKIVGFHIIARDITERKHAEEALRESEERYRTLIETSPDAITLTDLNFNIVMGNGPALTLYGYKNPEEVIGQSIFDFIVPEDRPRAVEDARKMLETGSIGTPEYTLLRKGGVPFSAEVRASMVMDAEKKPLAFICVSRDITERKRAEEALKSSEEKYRTILENIEDGYYEVDIAGNLTFFNDSMCQIYGYSREELMGMNDRRFTDQENAKKLFQAFNKVYRTGESTREFDWEIIRKDGTKRNIEASVSLMKDSSGNRIGFRGLVRDVTERKQIEKEKATLEEQLRQSQKIEAIGRLAGGIAHDFNNLLTVISGNCQLSLLELKEDVPLKGNIEEIKRASERAADLTRQLLAFSRRQIMEMKVLDLNSVLENLKKMLRRVIGEDIELVTMPGEDLGRIKADPGQIEQVIMNLAVNARDAMPDGGKLIIETANVELDEAYAQHHIAVKPGSYVMLSVSDTGIGMTSEVRERVFEPFFTTKGRGRGTGLGLSTVYGIVKQSGGNIWVYSEPGRGATFKIYLARVDEPLREIGDIVVREGVPRGSETILIVEDDEEVRKLAMRVLQRQGYDVLGAPEGLEAFLLCEEYEGPIDLLVTDVIMPKMSGGELAERIASIRPEIKVLYMSGYTDNAIVHHGVLMEGVNYLQKPFTVEGLARKVREALGKN